MHYGFVGASQTNHASADDEIRLDHVILPHLPESTKSQLQDVGFLGAYALLPSEYPCSRKEAKIEAEGCAANCRQPSELCFKTQVAVRAVLLTANEWEYFVTNGEDLSGDKSAAVKKWLQPHLQHLAADSIKKGVALDNLAETIGEQHLGAVTMLKERWKQINLHVGKFLCDIAETKGFENASVNDLLKAAT